jgi:hypothetical protein
VRLEQPTFQVTQRFERDRKQLTPESRARFQRVIAGQFVPDLARGVFRAGLRVKGVQAASGVFEITWAPDGRATFSHGPEQQAGEPHAIWRRIGTHDILREH